MLRPFGGVANSDHPYFTGSNPGFDPQGGFGGHPIQWDVDTDGDGLPDAVWIDLGMPVMTAPDGTTYKPLFAIQCLDLDGRLNVNTDGNPVQTETSLVWPAVQQLLCIGQQWHHEHPAQHGRHCDWTGGFRLGYGPSEISLYPLYSQNGQSTLNASILSSYYAALFAGTVPGGPLGTVTLSGRYGELTPSGNATYTPNTQPGNGTPPYAGYTSSSLYEYVGSPLGAVKHFDLPIPGYPQTPTAYASPPDLWGQAFVVLDIQGTPLYSNIANANSGQYDTLNNPYVLNLSQSRVRGSLPSDSISTTISSYQTTPDDPFTLAELERGIALQRRRHKRRRTGWRSCWIRRFRAVIRLGPGSWCCGGRLRPIATTRRPPTCRRPTTCGRATSARRPARPTAVPLAHRRPICWLPDCRRMERPTFRHRLALMLPPELDERPADGHQSSVWQWPGRYGRWLAERRG